MNKEQLIAFEQKVADLFESGAIPGPIHLSGGNEDQLIEIFEQIKPTDWVFSTWRSHFHALLHGIPEDLVMDQIRDGRSMNLMFPEYRFFTSAIVGGILPIATGVAMALKGYGPRVWCFIGDMAATTGVVDESIHFASGHDLPLEVVIEINHLSCNSPTSQCWGPAVKEISRTYVYDRGWPHCGTGKWVQF